MALPTAADRAWSKEAVRQDLLAARRAQGARVARRRSAAIGRHVVRLSAFRDAALVFAYAPVRGEVDPAPVVRAALRAGKAVAFPRVLGPRLMTFHRVADPAALVPGAFGVPEPTLDAGPAVAPDAATLILVPGVAFSARGGRLGWGGGFYDAFLRDRPAGAVAVGLAYGFQLLPEVPTGPGDAPVQAVVTERGPGLAPQSGRSSTSAPPT